MAELAVIGTLISAGATIAGGVAQNNAAKFEAQQMDMKAKEETAASQRDAMAKTREGNLINSRAQAIAASSGAGAGTDAPTIVSIMSRTAGEAQYNAGTSMYGGDSRARGLRDSAKGKRASGKASMLGSVMSGFGKGLSAFG